MLKRNIISLGAATFAAILSAQAAQALCTAPTLESPNDLIIQLRSSASGETFFGAGSAIDVNSATARSKGALYFDATSNSLVTCDGTDWVAVGGSGADGADGSGNCQFEREKTYTTNYNHNGQGQQSSASAAIPASELGNGDFRISGYARAGSGGGTKYCTVEMETDSGWVHIGTPSHYYYDDGPRGTGVSQSADHTEFDITVIMNDDGTYTWTQNSGDYINHSGLSGPLLGSLRGTPHDGWGSCSFAYSVTRLDGMICEGGGSGGGGAGGTGAGTETSIPADRAVSGYKAYPTDFPADYYTPDQFNGRQYIEFDAQIPAEDAGSGDFHFEFGGYGDSLRHCSFDVLTSDGWFSLGISTGSSDSIGDKKTEFKNRRYDSPGIVVVKKGDGAYDWISKGGRYPNIDSVTGKFLGKARIYSVYNPDPTKGACQAYFERVYRANIYQ